MSTTSSPEAAPDDLSDVSGEVSVKDAKRRARGKRAWRIMGSGSALIGGLVAARILDATWKTATGHKPPTKPESPDVDDREAILWAALSGMAVAAARVYATRRAASYWTRSFGEPPPGNTDKKASKKAAKSARREAAKAAQRRG